MSVEITDSGAFENFLHGKKDVKRGCVIVLPDGKIIIPDEKDYPKRPDEKKPAKS